jgi:hypothetical protein
MIYLRKKIQKNKKRNKITKEIILEDYNRGIINIKDNIQVSNKTIEKKN